MLPKSHLKDPIVDEAHSNFENQDIYKVDEVADVVNCQPMVEVVISLVWKDTT